MIQTTLTECGKGRVLGSSPESWWIWQEVEASCHPSCVSRGSILDRIGPWWRVNISPLKYLWHEHFSHFFLSVCVSGTQVFSGQSDFRVTTLKFHPKDHNVFLCGGFSSEIKAWDMRTGKVTPFFSGCPFMCGECVCVCVSLCVCVCLCVRVCVRACELSFKHLGWLSKVKISSVM